MKVETKDDNSHTENIRANEELRRAITSEIRAQEAYENAKKKMENTEKDMVRIRSELDKSKESVDMLKLEERLQRREPVEEAKLETGTVEGRQFEKSLGNYCFRKAIENVIDKVIQKGGIIEKKPEEKTPEIFEDTVIKIADALNITVDDTRRFIAEKQMERKIKIDKDMKKNVEIIRDKTLNRIFELLSAGADGEEIRGNVATIGLGISIIDVQQLVEYYNEKITADKAMIQGIEELGDAPG